MICETCHGSRLVAGAPCPDCIGGVSSCCDAAGSSVDAATGTADDAFPLPSFTCPRCGAVSYNPNDVRERFCGHCHAFVDDLPPSPGVAKRRARDAYRDDHFLERACDRCGKPYRGPSVYCSIECAIADA